MSPLARLHLRARYLDCQPTSPHQLRPQLTPPCPRGFSTILLTRQGARPLSVSAVQMSTPPRRNLEKELQDGVVPWERRTLFSTSRNAVTANEPYVYTLIDLPWLKIPWICFSSGSSTSPISIASSPASLPRPKGVPIYSSPISRTSYSPPTPRFCPPISSSSKPLHPFFNPPPPPPPKRNAPRLVAQYSSTSSGSQSTTTETQSTSSVYGGMQDQIDFIAAEVERMEVSQNAARKLPTKPKPPVVRAGYQPKPRSSSSRSPTPPAHSTVPPPTSVPTALSGSSTRPALAASRAKAKPKPNVLSSTSHLPLFSHATHPTPPKVIYTNCAAEVDDLLACLHGPVLGFDMEWPVFGWQTSVDPTTGQKKSAPVGGTWNGQKWVFGQAKTALIQICDERLVILIHLTGMEEIPKSVVELLANKEIYKTGVQVRGDGLKISRDFPEVFASLQPKSLLELSWLARKVDTVKTGPGHGLIALAKLCAEYLGAELPKGDVRKSNWDQALTKEQIEYAANDVYASMQIYLHLKRLGDERGIDVDLREHASDLGDFMVTSPTDTLGGPSTPSVLPTGTAKMRALALFMGGKTIEEIAASAKIKENTAL
ncbi:hypothetical protein P7C73_g4502, partial [Tremellales sp. Uapishka_1]